MLASLPQEQQQAFLASLKPDQLAFLRHDWQFWGRPDQQMPDSDWFVWMILAGRGWGKTRTAVENIAALLRGPTPLQAPKDAPAIMSIIADNPFDMRQYSIEGPSGFLHVGPQDYRPHYEPSKKTLTWPNGAKALLFSAEDPETLRGASGSFFWWDELAKSRYARDGWNNMLFGMREGNPRGIVTTTPRPTPLLKELIARKSTHVTRGSTWDNRDNLSEVFYREVIEPLMGTRLGRQEIEAEILDDVPGALWSRDMIEGLRAQKAPELTRIVVAIDPPTTSGEDADECGIIVAGKDGAGRGYILADRSVKGATPNQWATKAVEAYHTFNASRIVAETNQGGEMIEALLRQIDPNVAYRGVHAKSGKVIRAEPVAALYERALVFHVGAFPALEDQMVSFTTDFDPAKEGYSPDRVDALVHALTDLMVERQGGQPRVRTI